MATKIGETISSNQFNEMYPVGKTISASAFSKTYGDQQDQSSKKQSGFLQQIGAGAKNIVKNIGGALISSEKKFGEDIGKSAYLALGGNKQISETNQRNIDSGNQLLSLAKKTTDSVKKRQLIELAAESFKSSGIGSEDIIGQIKSNKQILGDAGGVLIDILSAGTYGNAAKGLKFGQLTKPTAINQITKGVGFKQGFAKAAPVGAAIGTSQGVAGAMQEDKSVGNILLSGVEGGLIGGAISGVLGGVSGKIQAKTLGVEKQQTALDSIIPSTNELSADEYSKLLNTGRVTPKTKLGTAKIVPNNKEITLANEYSDFLQSKDPVRNTKNIVDEIIDSDTKVENYLEKQIKNGDYVGFDKNVLKKNLQGNIKDITDIYVPNEKRLAKMKEDLIKGFVDLLPEKPTLKDLWKARKSYDSQIDARMNAFGGSPTLKKELSVSIRNGVQDFISNETGDTFYKSQMKRMTDLYDILDMVDTKAIKERGYSSLSAWLKANPGKANIIKAAGGIGLTYLMYSGLQKVGGGQ